MARVDQEKRVCVCVCVILMYFDVCTVHLVQFIIQTSSHHTRKHEKPTYNIETTLIRQSRLYIHLPSQQLPRTVIITVDTVPS